VVAESNENDSMKFPSDLNIGDLLFCDVKPNIQNIADTYNFSQIQSLWSYADDHVAMYIGNNKFIEANPYFYAPFQQEWFGVVITPYWLFKLWATNITFGYVKADQEIRDAAVSWAKTQIGKPYGENGYTCAELIFEAYKKQNLLLQYTSIYNNKTHNASIPYILMRSNQVVLYSNILPTADISDSLSYNYVNDEIYFYAYDSYDEDGIIKEYIWDFGDGLPSEKYFYYDGASVIHIFKKPGNYTITLTVIDNAGASDTDTTAVIIKEENDYFDDDDDEGDTNEPDNDKPEDVEGEDNPPKIIEESDIGLSILIAMIFIIFLSIIVLIFVIKK